MNEHLLSLISKIMRLYSHLLKFLMQLFLLICIGCLVGFSVSLFLILLKIVTDFRIQNQTLIYFLPFLGIISLALYKKWGCSVDVGLPIVFNRISSLQAATSQSNDISKNKISFVMFPLILGGTLLTHLGGGSAGREGTALQMGTSIVDHMLNVILKLSKNLKNMLEKSQSTVGRLVLNNLFKTWYENLNSNKTYGDLLIFALGSSFGAALGAPIAGAIFGLESNQKLKAKIKFLLLPISKGLLVSWVAYQITLIVEVPHTLWPHIILKYNFAMAIKFLIFASILGILSGVLSFLFQFLVQGIKDFVVWCQYKINDALGIFFKSKKDINFLGSYLIVFLGSVVLVFMLNLNNGMLKYSGLGIEHITSFYNSQQSFSVATLKIIFTAITLGLGFKGGEFIPSVFIGTALASFLGGIFDPNYLSPMTAFGFGAIYAAIANVPLTCSIMVGELFGYEIIFFALITNYVSTYSKRAIRSLI